MTEQGNNLAGIKGLIALDGSDPLRLVQIASRTNGIHKISLKSFFEGMEGPGEVHRLPPIATIEVINELSSIGVPSAEPTLTNLLLQLHATVLVMKEREKPSCDRMPIMTIHQTATAEPANFAKSSFTTAETYTLMPKRFSNRQTKTLL